MKRWIKYGLIVVGINAILMLTYYLINSIAGPLSYDSFASFLILPAFLITDVVYWGTNSVIVMIITSTIFYFLIGALIGWIVGKVKERKK